MSRRRFLGLGAGALGVLGFGSAVHSTPSSVEFFEPEVRRSASGFLTTTLRASSGPAIVQGQAVIASTYEGTFPGPTLRVRPGDFLQVELINDLLEETNLHVHGLHVTPQTPGDNILLHIPAGGRFVYQYLIPPDHPGGTYFYHPHFHGTVANQAFQGMSGLIIVDGDIDEIPAIAGLPERSFVLQRTVIVNGQIPSFHAGAGNVLVNGANMPTLFIRPGETQRWRLLNASIGSLWSIQVEGHQMTLISRDGNTLAQAQTMDSLSLVTAQRRDVLIQGGQPGTYQLTFRDEQGAGFGPPQTFAFLVVTGSPAEQRELPTLLLPFEDLRNVPIDRQRTITFNTFNNHFTIDGQVFDENRVDQFATLGDVEEWTVKNTTGGSHPFHIHINPYQVTHVNGQPFEAPSYEDTTNVPATGSITFRTRYEDFSGTFVYHCHILQHEDNGMMGTIQVACRPLATLPVGPGFRPTSPGFRPTGPRAGARGFHLRPSCQ